MLTLIKLKQRRKTILLLLKSSYGRTFVVDGSNWAVHACISTLISARSTMVSMDQIKSQIIYSMYVKICIISHQQLYNPSYIFSIFIYSFMHSNKHLFAERSLLLREENKYFSSSSSSFSCTLPTTLDGRPLMISMTVLYWNYKAFHLMAASITEQPPSRWGSPPPPK